MRCNGSRLRRSRFAVFLLLTAVVTGSCGYIDPGAFFGASWVDDRFSEAPLLPQPTAPSVADPSDFTFFVISDTHYYKNPRVVYRTLTGMMSAAGASFVLTLGDITQAGTAYQFGLFREDRDILTAAGYPVYQVLGNHDLYNDGFEIFKEESSSVYCFTVGQTEFIILDTANGTLGALQKEWYEQILKNSTADNILVFTHYSPVVESSIEATVMPYPKEVYYLLDRNSEEGVDCFFAGHMHYFKEETVRGVRYYVVSNSASGKNNILKVHISGMDISVTPISAAF